MTRRRTLDLAQVAAAAVAIADADGLAAVTIARVAGELGIKGPSLYNHVAGRDALVREVALRGLTELTDALVMASAGRSGADALRAAGRAYRAYATTYPARYAAGLRAPGPDDPELRALSDRGLEALGAALRGFELEGDALVHVLRALRSALHGFVALEAAGGFGLPTSLEASFERMLSMLLAGIAAPGRPA